MNRTYEDKKWCVTVPSLWFNTVSVAGPKGCVSTIKETRFYSSVVYGIDKGRVEKFTMEQSYDDHRIDHRIHYRTIMPYIRQRVNDD